MAKEERIRANRTIVNAEDLIIMGFDNKQYNHPLCDKESNEHPAEQDEERIRNVKRYGVIEPIVVVPEDGKLIVAAGRRRTRWLRQANKENAKHSIAPMKVEVSFQKGDDQKLRGVMISENVHRHVVDPMTFARQASELYNVNKWQVSEIAIALGKDESTVKTWLNVDNMDEEVSKAHADGEIEGTAALELAKHPKAVQKERLRKGKEAAAKKKKGKAKGKVTLAEVRKQNSRAAKNGFEAPSKTQIRSMLKNETISIPDTDLVMAKWFIGEGPAPEWAAA